MANEKNIEKYKFGNGARTASEERKIQSKGGVASGVARSFKAATKAMLKENPDLTSEVTKVVADLALQGNLPAIKLLLELNGETVQREELALKKKALQSKNKTDNGKAEELIAGLVALPEGGAVAEGD